MDTRNWFGEHAHTIRIIALLGGLVLAAIILFDVLAQKGKQQAAAAGIATDPAAAATQGGTVPAGTLGSGYTDINVYQDYSTHNGASGSVTSNQYTPPSYLYRNRVPATQMTLPPSRYIGPAMRRPPSLPPYVPGGFAQPGVEAGGPVPVTAPHPADAYSAPTDYQSLYDYGGRYPASQLN